jgi:type IV pilus assembly protein PilA
MKKLNKKGFTLAELLIVVAIIAVMAAIAIPIFTAQLGKAQAATDEANIRSGYANASANALTDSTVVKGTTAWYLNPDGTVGTASTGAYTTKGNSDDLDKAGVNIGGTADIQWTSGKTVSYQVTTDGKIKIVIGQ